MINLLSLIYIDYILKGTKKRFQASRSSEIITVVKMELIKVEIVDMSDPEPCKVKDEDTEEQRGRCPFMILND